MSETTGSANRMRSRTSAWFALLALAVVVSVFNRDLLVGRLPRGEDPWLLFMPAYAVGDPLPPRWNPHIFGGLPFAGNPQFSAWYPLRWLFIPFDVLSVFGIYCYLHLLLAAAAMFVSLRMLGCRSAGAMIGALSFACGSYIQGRLSNPALLISSAWLPLVAAMALRTFGHRGVHWPVGLGLLLAIVLFAGSPLTMIYAGLIVALAAVWVCLFGGGGMAPDPPPFARRIRDVSGRFALALGIGFGLAAVQLLPTVELVARSHRGELPVEALARDPVAWHELDNLFLGASTEQEYLDKSVYFGMCMLPLLLLSLLVSRHRRLAMLFLATSLAGVWISMGLEAGAFQTFRHLPVLRSLSGPSRALVLPAVGASALIGLGVDGFLRVHDRRNRRMVWFASSAALAIAAGLAVSVVGRAKWLDVVEALRHAGSYNTPEVFPPINGAIFLTVGALLLLAVRSTRLPHYVAASAIAVLLFVDLFHFHQRLPLPMTGREALAMPDMVRKILDDDDRPFRVVGYEPTRPNAGSVNDESLRQYLMPNLAALYGLQDIQGFDPLILRDYVRLVEATAGRSIIDDPARMLNIARPDRTLFQLLNVRYVAGDVRERPLDGFRPTRSVDDRTVELDRPTTIAGVSFVSLLDGARGLPDGAPVAEVIAGDGRATQAAVLQAGVHTADWTAAGEPALCTHGPAPVNTRWEVARTPRPMPVANYFGRIIFDKPVRAKTVRLRQTHPGVVLVVSSAACIEPDAPGWDRVYERDRHRLYRNRDVLGGAWIVHRLRTVEDQDEALDLLARDEIDLAREAVVAGNLGLPPGAGGPTTPTGNVEFLRYDPDRIEVRAQCDRPGLLCFAEVYYQGWKARLDGRPVPIERVNFIQRGIVIPEGGSHRVTLRYAPSSLAFGKAISLATLLVAIAILLRSFLAERACV